MRHIRAYNFIKRGISTVRMPGDVYISRHGFGDDVDDGQRASCLFPAFWPARHARVMNVFPVGIIAVRW
jgi:hypothetical protein